MSLRATIKPPRPFPGDVIDDLSPSILGDRRSDNSKPRGASDAPLSTPSTIPSLEQQPEMEAHQLQQDRRRKRTSTSIKNKSSKRSRIARETSGSTSREATPSFPKSWRPGLGMTPANNKKYLGPQTEYNPNLPPAAFPTIDLDKSVDIQENYRPLRACSKSPNSHQDNASKPALDLDSDKVPSNVTNGQGDKDSANIKSLDRLSSKPCSDKRTRIEPRELWDEISTYYRFEIVDSISSTSRPAPNTSQILNELPLSSKQKQEMIKVLQDRQDRDKEEDRRSMKLSRETTKYLMKNTGPISEEKFRDALNKTIYKNTGNDEHLITRPNDRQNARAFLTMAGFSPDILDNDDLACPTPPRKLEVEPGGQGLGLQEKAPSSEVSDALPIKDPMKDSEMIGPNKGHTANGVSLLSKRQRRHNDKVVAAAVNCDPRLRAGTALTGGGLNGLNTCDVDEDIPLVDEMLYEEWVHEMDRRYEESEKLLERKAIQEVMEDDDILHGYNPKWKF